MLVKFKRDLSVTIDGLDDKYVDNTFTFKKDNCYYGYNTNEKLIVESKDGYVSVELDNDKINEYIEW